MITKILCQNNPCVSSDNDEEFVESLNMFCLILKFKDNKTNYSSRTRLPFFLFLGEWSATKVSTQKRKVRTKEKKEKNDDN